MAVKFIIDSASDVLPAECEKVGATHLPLKVLFGQEEYADAVTLSHREFYEKLTSGTAPHPTTSQVTPAEFEEAYERVAANGDTAVVITLSSKLSGTYQSACIAAEEYEGKVFVLDSLSATVGERLLLQRGLELAAQGVDAENIHKTLDEEKNRIRIFARLDTLEYLKKGGRISAATAVVGGLLNIKPIIAVRDGLVESVGKARGPKQADALLRELIAGEGGVDFSKPACLAYSGQSDENVQKFQEDSDELWNGRGDRLGLASVGCVIGTHVGPGAVAIAFFANK